MPRVRAANPLRNRLLAGVLLALARPPAVSALPAAPLEICVDDPVAEQAFARELTSWMRGRAIRLRPTLGCAVPSTEPALGRFAQAGRGVVFSLRHRGQVLTRSVPWVTSSQHALRALSGLGRLSAFAVLLQGLVAEAEIGPIAARSDSQDVAPTQPPPGLGHDSPPARAHAWASAVAAARNERHGEARSTRRLPVPTRPAVSRLTPNDVSIESGLTPNSVPIESKPIPPTVPFDEPRAVAPLPATTGPPRPDLPETVTPPSPAPAGTSTVATRSETTSAAPRPSPATAATFARRLAQARKAPPPEPDDEPMAARLRRGSDPSPRWRLTLAAHGGAHWRSPDLVLAEVGGSLGWGPFFVRAGYQVPRDWTLSERPLRVSAVDLGAGWRRVVWTRRSWRLLLDVAVLLDRISLRRTDVAGASDHDFWDVGLGGGARLSRQLGHGLNLAAALNATVYLTGREVAITDGPSTRVNVVGLQPTLALSWEP